MSEKDRAPRRVEHDEEAAEALMTVFEDEAPHNIRVTLQEMQIPVGVELDVLPDDRRLKHHQRAGDDRVAHVAQNVEDAAADVQLHVILDESVVVPREMLGLLERHGTTSGCDKPLCAQKRVLGVVAGSCRTQFFLNTQSLEGINLSR